MQDLVRFINNLRREHKEVTDIHIRNEEKISSVDREKEYIFSNIKENIDLDVKTLEEAEKSLAELEELIVADGNQAADLLRKMGRNV